MKTIQLKVNNVPGHSGTVTIQTDENGVPLERFWRNRIKDAAVDNCVEVVKPSKPVKTRETEK